MTELVPAAPLRVPPLPARPDGERWHANVTTWWRAVWRSPLATLYDASDQHGGLLRYALLLHEFWSGPSTKDLLAIAAELRHLGDSLGLTPVSRYRLRLDLTAPAAPAAPKQPPPAKSDPRNLLRVVS